MSEYKYKISDAIDDIERELDECIMCEGSFCGCGEYFQLCDRLDMLRDLDKRGFSFIDENDNIVLENGTVVQKQDEYNSVKNDSVYSNCDGDVATDDVIDDDADDADLAAAVLEDVLDILDVSDKVLDILEDAEFETHVITTDAYDSVNVSITTDFGYSTAAGKTYPYNVCSNDDLLSSIVFDLVRDIVIELEGNYAYMRLMFENCVN